VPNGLTPGPVIVVLEQVPHLLHLLLLEPNVDAAFLQTSPF